MYLAICNFYAIRFDTNIDRYSENKKPNLLLAIKKLRNILMVTGCDYCIQIFGDGPQGGNYGSKSKKVSLTLMNSYNFLGLTSWNENVGTESFRPRID